MSCLTLTFMALCDILSHKCLGFFIFASRSSAIYIGQIRSAASFALARAAVDGASGDVTKADLEKALMEVVAAAGKRDEELEVIYIKSYCAFCSVYNLFKDKFGSLL